MAKTTWGRKETIVWPYHIPIYAYSAAFAAAALTFVFVCAWIRFATTPLQRYYLPLYERTSAIGAFSKTHRSNYSVLFVAGHGLSPRPAQNADVMLGRTPEPDGKTIPLQLSADAPLHGYTLFFRGPLRSFSDARLRDYMKDVVYGGTSLPAFFRPPLIGGALVFLILLPFAVLKDVQRQKQLRYGRRLKGPEMLTPRQFNRVVKGDGIGFKIDGMRKMLRIPARAEAQHMQIIGDTGAGKSALMFQMLRQVCSRGDSAIVYDPARE
jgi:hypothetical protein